MSQSQTRDAIASFLREQSQNGKQFFKSKYIAKAIDIDLSSRQVGQHLLVLQDEVDDLSIEKYACSRATTWKIKCTEPRLVTA